MIAKGIKIFLQKRKAKCLNMPVKDIKVLLKKIKKKCQCYCDYQKSLPEDRKQTIAEIKRNSYITHKNKGQAS